MPLNIKPVFHLKLFSKATVGVCPLFLVVSLEVLHPHSHTSAQLDTRGQTRVMRFVKKKNTVPRFQYSSVCSCHNVKLLMDVIMLYDVNDLYLHFGSGKRKSKKQC